jgi:hypothetical protein
MTKETHVLRLRRGDRAVLEGWARYRTLERRLVGSCTQIQALDRTQPGLP